MSHLLQDGVAFSKKFSFVPGHATEVRCWMSGHAETDRTRITALEINILLTAWFMHITRKSFCLKSLTYGTNFFLSAL